MANQYFFTLFKNIPYTDEEWERDNVRRQRIQESTCSEQYKLKFAPRQHRPNFGFRWGPSASSLKEARAICDKALLQGAQQVECGLSGDHGYIEHWVRRKGEPWKQIINPGSDHKRKS
jgi:hypothetical protein